MTIELKETSTVLAAWFISTEHDMDWMAVCYRDNDDAPWRATGRFRFYLEETAWGDKDVKKWSTFNPPPELCDEEVFAVINQTMLKLEKHMEGKLTTLRGPYTSDQYIQVLSKQEWAHTKVEKINEQNRDEEDKTV